MYCNKCGTQNADDTAFCSKCGTNLKSIKPEIERKGITGKLGKMGIPEFRSGKTWKMGLAFIGYFFIIIILLAAFSGRPSPAQNSDSGTSEIMTATTSTSGNVEQTIPETYTDIYHKLENCGTVLQCDEWVNSYLNKNKVHWTGTFVDANAEKAIVDVDFAPFATGKAVVRKVDLNNIPTNELIKLNKGQNITFIGQLKIDTATFRDYNGMGNRIWSQAWDGNRIELYNVEIQNIDI